MKPHMNETDIIMFYQYLDKSCFYFEYGSGGSTYQASIRPNIKRIISIESDIEWHNTLKSKIAKSNPNVEFVYRDMKTRPNDWGNPGPGSNIHDWRKYSGAIVELGNSKIDTVLIDGRFRVACCLKCFDIISDDCFIVFDDFLNRFQYHVVLEFYDIVEKTKDNCMAILTKKKGVDSPSRELIEKYESIQG